MSEILEAINNALRDNTVSSDAMRWTPHPPSRMDAAAAAQGFEALVQPFRALGAALANAFEAMARGAEMVAAAIAAAFLNRPPLALPEPPHSFRPNLDLWCEVCSLGPEEHK